MGYRESRRSRGSVLVFSSAFMVAVIGIALFVRGGSSAQIAVTPSGDDTEAITTTTTETAVSLQSTREKTLDNLATGLEEANSRFEKTVAPNIPAAQKCSEDLYTVTNNANAVVAEVDPDLRQGDLKAPLQVEVDRFFSTVEAAVDTLKNASDSVAEQTEATEKLMKGQDLARAQASLASLNSRIDVLSGYIENCPTLVVQASDLDSRARKIVIAQGGTPPTPATTSPATTTTNPKGTTTVPKGTTTVPKVTTTVPKVTTTVAKPKPTTTVAKPTTTTKPSVTSTTTTVKPTTTTTTVKPTTTTTTVKPTTTASPTTTVEPTTVAPTTVAPTTTEVVVTAPPPPVPVP